MQMTEDQFTDRALGYLILREIFANEPSKELFKKFAEERVFPLFPYREINRKIDEICSKIAEIIMTCRIGDLSDDYNEMFMINCLRSVYPWESPHRNDEKLMFQKSMLSVLAFYRRYNIELAQKSDVADSLPNELEFMYRTSIKVANCEDTNMEQRILKDQLAFCENHINVWVPQLAGLTANTAKTDFYKYSARLLEQFVFADYELLKKQLA